MDTPFVQTPAPRFSSFHTQSDLQADIWIRFSPTETHASLSVDKGGLLVILQYNVVVLLLFVISISLFLDTY